jgi:glycosyltransferase involved in cell wall biosynthesis
MKICYPLPAYRSHRRVAAMYRQILGRRHAILPSRRHGEADVVILHEEPHNYDALYAAHPGLRDKYVIAYCVWETTDLPEAFKRSIAHVQEIWTCSDYCLRAFGRYHPRVAYVPHVIEREVTCSPADVDHVKQAIAYETGKRHFVTIARGWGGRKNVNALVRAFARLPELRDARIVLKVEGHNQPRTFEDERVRWVAQDWTDAQIDALYQLADVYVSPHYGEGWGLTMSDAMLFGKPVVATGYSGNLEFMHDQNSWLLACEEREIRDEDRYALYQPPMRWAYPDEGDLVEKLRWLYHAFETNEHAARVQRALVDLRRFDQHAVGRLMEARLEATTSRA